MLGLGKIGGEPGYFFDLTVEPRARCAYSVPGATNEHQYTVTGFGCTAEPIYIIS